MHDCKWKSNSNKKEVSVVKVFLAILLSIIHNKLSEHHGIIGGGEENSFWDAVEEPLLKPEAVPTP